MSVFDLIRSGGQTIGTGVLKSKVPIKFGPTLSAGIEGIKSVAAGDYIGAAGRVINSGIFTAKLPWLDGAAAAIDFHAEPSRSMYGVQPLQAKKIMQESLQTHFGHKNLFMLDVVGDKIEGNDYLDGSTGLMHPAYSAPQARFNLFVLDLDYGPCTIVGEKHKIGSAVLDQPTGSEHIELRMTTLDNERGGVKRWFAQLSEKVAHLDGTFGLPASYLVKFKILHSFVTEESAQHWLSRDGKSAVYGTQPWSTSAWFRPVSMELNLSRRDESLEEITLVFTQYDTTHK